MQPATRPWFYQHHLPLPLMDNSLSTCYHLCFFGKRRLTRKFFHYSKFMHVLRLTQRALEKSSDWVSQWTQWCRCEGLPT